MEYNWIVWKNCRLVGYVTAFSEWEATKKAEEKFGRDTFVERTCFEVQKSQLPTP